MRAQRVYIRHCKELECPRPFTSSTATSSSIGIKKRNRIPLSIIKKANTQSCETQSETNGRERHKHSWSETQLIATLRRTRSAARPLHTNPKSNTSTENRISKERESATCPLPTQEGTYPPPFPTSSSIWHYVRVKKSKAILLQALEQVKMMRRNPIPFSIVKKRTNTCTNKWPGSSRRGGKSGSPRAPRVAAPVAGVESIHKSEGLGAYPKPCLHGHGWFQGLRWLNRDETI